MENGNTPFSFGLEPRHLLRNRRYTGIWVGVLTVLVVAATFFCEMHMTAAPAEQTAMTAAVTVLACFIMYTSLFDAGRQKSIGEEAYRTLSENFCRLRERIGRTGGESLERFCTAYVGEELRRTRETILGSVGERYETFLAYQAGEMTRETFRALSRPRRRALCRAARLKPLRLTAAMLLCEHLGQKRGLVLSGRRGRLKRTVNALIPTLFGSLVTVAVTLEGSEPTPATVIAGLLRIFNLIWTGARGYIAGCNAVSEEESAALETKSTLLELYLGQAKVPIEEGVN